ncbi:accessory Sec system glycosyltransferase GtfA [Streptococcus cristatus]|uniref:UDP-N-acetylglucosamine--peptide N-acetylglucosaminyltransferase GtfA subunit n=1 Tax=Streptococcus cristatus TaxID=45634 RepID=A0A5B0DBL3_STRCR|nr:accessory Sec system glycosyltransferase GtfA [Streptococcus cristatus]KAA0963332.1 accessory Sec system glycosyltransferase GtfA [Streptococcus cristatus]
MTIYNINLGIGWASSGVEYAQIYRAKLLRSVGLEAKFIFMDFISADNIEHLTKNIGFEDSEVIWLYQYFTDVKIAPTTYTLSHVLASFDREPLEIVRNPENKTFRVMFGDNDFVTCYACDMDSELIERAEIVSRGCLIQKEYYTYTKNFIEYYSPVDGRARLYQRTWLNEDGSVAYEEIIDEVDGKPETQVYRFPDQVFYSKQEFVAHFMRSLKLTDKDLLILDRETDIGQPIFANKGAAKLAVIVHADHFSENPAEKDYILWNNYYEYQFEYAEEVDYIINSTDAQTELLKEQFAQYTDIKPKEVLTIPVGSLDQLRRPEGPRKPFALMTASRLASEKHIDWLIHSVVKAHEQLPEITFDIYGTGGEEAMLRKLLADLKAEDYIRLMGHHHMTDIYKNYSAYLAASTSEGFGLTLLEAVGSGLPIIGFDVRYGNPTFIRDGENGYLIPKARPDDLDAMTTEYAEKIVQLLTQHSQEDLSRVSYEVAEHYLDEHIAQRWSDLVRSAQTN